MKLFVFRQKLGMQIFIPFTKALIDHTASHLLEILDILPFDIIKKQNVLNTLTLKYDFDGTSSHNPYNQAFSDSTKSD